MVFPNSNEFFNVTSQLDENMAKLIQQEQHQHQQQQQPPQHQMENFMASASSSPVQDYLLAPSNM
ncbi:hypothetical protein BG006_011494, partial [Podila minutissima]